MQRFYLTIIKHNLSTKGEDEIKKLIKYGLEDMVNSVNFTRFKGKAQTLTSWMHIIEIEVESDKRIYDDEIENWLMDYNEYFTGIEVRELPI